MRQKFIRKKRIALISCLAFCIVLVVGVGSVFAYMYHKTEVVTNDFDVAVVACAVEESFNETSGMKSSIKVENTGNIDAYLRVALVSYWVDDKGKIVGIPSEMPAVDYDKSKWIKASGEHIYYFKEDVSPKDSTTELLTSPMVLTSKEYDGKLVYQVVEVFAEAIQSKPASAVEDAWRVSVDDSGNI